MSSEQEQTGRCGFVSETLESTREFLRGYLKNLLTRLTETELDLSKALNLAILSTKIARAEVIGAENLAQLEAPFICALNHSSLYLLGIQIPPIDVLVVMSNVEEIIGKEIVFIGKTNIPSSPFPEELTDSLMQALYSRIPKIIPVNTEKRFLSAARVALQKLKAGVILLICPEGASQRKYNRESEYHDGAAWLALRASLELKEEVPIIPIAVRNAYSIKDVLLGRIEVVIGNPIYPQEVANDIVKGIAIFMGIEVVKEIELEKLRGYVANSIVVGMTIRLQQAVNELYYGTAVK